MLLAIAVLLIQPSAMSISALSYDKIDETSAAAAAKDDKAAQKSDSRPASAPTAAPVNTNVFPTQQPQTAQAGSQGNEISYVPGQIGLARVNATGEESSSRAESGVTTESPMGAPASFKPVPYSRVREAGRVHGFPRKWMILSAVEHGAATFDAYSTRRVINNGTGYEMNPMLKPFANSGALYGAVQIAPVAFDFLSLKMMHSSHTWMRKLWWVPQSASAAASLFGGVHNTMMH
jgi:hypothetical protein